MKKSQVYNRQVLKSRERTGIAFARLTIADKGFSERMP
jgi:hypothetical protein